MGLRMPRALLARCVVLALLASAVLVAVRRAAHATLEAGELALTHPAGDDRALPPGSGLAPARAVDAASARPAPEIRTWSELKADATRLLGRRVRFVVQMHSRVEHWNAYLSRFGPHDTAVFQFWADEQFPWRVDDFDAPLVRLFVRRDTDAEAELVRGTRYARFEIVGTVREVFLGEPWVEVENALLLPERVTEGTVIHGGRALALVESGQWILAASEVDVALQANLPRAAREELERLRDDCRRRAASLGNGTERRESRPWKGPAPNVRPPKPRTPDVD